MPKSKQKIHLINGLFIITCLILVISLPFLSFTGINKAQATTLLSDDFTGSSINPAKWSVIDPGGTNITQNNQLEVRNSKNPTWGATVAKSVDTFSRTNLSIQSKMTATGGSPLMGYGDYNFQSVGTYAYLVYLAGGSIYALSWENGALAYSNFACGTYTAGATYKMSMTGTGFTVYKDTGSGFVSQCSLTASTTVNNKPMILESETTVSYFDDVLVDGEPPVLIPSAISDLASISQDTAVRLDWTAPAANGAAITDYIVKYRIYGATSWTTFNDGVGTGVTTTITSLLNSTRYEFNVAAVNSYGTAPNSNLPTSYPMGQLFSDTIDSLNDGAIAGQNNWQAVGTGTWTVGSGNGGKMLSQTATLGSDLFHTNQVSNGHSSWTNQRVKVDIQKTASEIGQIWIRKSAATGDGAGYILHQTGNNISILKHTAGSGATYSTLATGSFSMTNGSWYTLEIEAINNTSNNPIIKVWVYDAGGAKGTALLSYTDSSSPFSSGYIALGTNRDPINYDNVYVYGMSSDALTLTAPTRGISVLPQTATISITDEGGTFTIPYIQTSTSLTVSATVGSGILPASGGVKFIINEGLAGEQVLYDMSSPFSVDFADLAKGTYTVDAYVVDSGQVVQTGSGRHELATGVGIGDIITAIGDSITEGYYGNDYGTSAVTNWLDAPMGSISSDNRNFPQYGPVSVHYKTGFLNELNNELTSYYGYPVFIMNEGVGGYDTTEYISLMGTVGWQNRQAALSSNKWIINLGVNDGVASVSPSTVADNLQTIISNLESGYGASSSNIWLAKPNYSAVYTYTENYLTVVDDLRTNMSLAGGPDFWNYYENHIALYGGDPVHPNVAGMTQMARLWAIAMMNPQNVAVSETTGTATVSWNDLSSVEATINGYKVKYGTVSGTYTTTVDAGDVLSKDISGLTVGQTYYFVVSAYDNDATVLNETMNSSEVSFNLAGVSVGAVSGHTSEAGDTATFSVVLQAQPSADVVIGVSSNNSNEGTFSPSSLTFTNINWATPQIVTATGVNDFIDDGNLNYRAVLSAATSSDQNYNNIDPNDVVLTNDDNDTAGMNVSKSSLAVAEGGATDSFTVVLNTEPVNDVTVDLSSLNSQILSSPASLVFTSLNWSSPQTVTVSALNDIVVEVSQSDSVVLTVSSGDANYNNFSLSNIPVSITDNDFSNSSSSPSLGPVGDGLVTVSISMGESKNIGIIDSTGINVLAYINSQAIFSIPTSQNLTVNQDHKLTIIGLDLFSNIVTLLIESNPQTIQLKLSDSVLIDLDNDLVNDLQIKFSNLTVNQVELTLKTVSAAAITNPGTSIVDYIKREAILIFNQSNPLNYFINNGTETTLKLGSGERAAAVSSFKEAFGQDPTTLAHWEDILNIANSRWPYGIVKTVEAHAYINFRSVYARGANMKNSTDVNALKMMGYGVRSALPRDLNKERLAIRRFISTFNFLPTIARHWNIVRAIAYSGLVK